jgi:hypothetical protein
MVIHSTSTGFFANALPPSFAGIATDAVMDEDGVIHVVLISGIWGGASQEGDPWSEVLYAKIDPINGLLYDQYLLAEGPLDEDSPGYRQTAICLGREVVVDGPRYVHVLVGFDPSPDFDDAVMLYARSTDGGNSWVAPTDVNAFDGLHSPPPCGQLCALRSKCR